MTPPPSVDRTRPRYLTAPPPGRCAGHLTPAPPVASPSHLDFDGDKVLLSGRRSPLPLEELVRYVQARGVFYVDLEGTAP